MFSNRVTPSYYTVNLPFRPSSDKMSREQARAERLRDEDILKQHGFKNSMRRATKAEGEALAAEIKAKTGLVLSVNETSSL